jgi:hypothetical protein
LQKVALHADHACVREFYCDPLYDLSPDILEELRNLSVVSALLSASKVLPPLRERNNICFHGCSLASADLWQIAVTVLEASRT